MDQSITFSYCPDCEAFKVLPCSCDPKPTKAPVAAPAPAANTAPADAAK